MRAIVLGDKSDLAQGLAPFMEADGWDIFGWSHGRTLCGVPWDLVLVALGQVAPVGLWWDKDPEDWDRCVYSNVLLPVRLLRTAWKFKRPGAAVCFMAGSNPQKPMAGYSAYNAGKMALLKVCEQLDFETPEVKFFALGPGYVPTKIHRATREANWPNERIARGDDGTPIAKIYDCLKWCMAQPKEIIGGRNICVSDPYGPELAERMRADASLYKLRRQE